MSENGAEHAPVSHRLYTGVWLALVALTVVTVSVSYLDMKKFTIFTALLIATVKAGLVILYFMHIRYEKLIYAIMILFVLVIYVIFIGLTFVDYSFR
jgi:cytochrome c oxidase subunit 4